MNLSTYSGTRDGSNEGFVVGLELCKFSTLARGSIGT